MNRSPLMTIYRDNKRFEAYTDGTMVVEDLLTGEILEEF